MIPYLSNILSLGWSRIPLEDEVKALPMRPTQGRPQSQEVGMCRGGGLWNIPKLGLFVRLFKFQSSPLASPNPTNASLKITNCIFAFSNLPGGDDSAQLSPKPDSYIERFCLKFTIPSGQGTISYPSISKSDKLENRVETTSKEVDQAVKNDHLEHGASCAQRSVRCWFWPTRQNP